MRLLAPPLYYVQSEAQSKKNFFGQGNKANTVLRIKGNKANTVLRIKGNKASTGLW